MMWVLNGGPWSFDNVMLPIHVIPPGEESVKILLWHLNIWIQIHELPTNFMSETIEKQLGNFFREFLEYDSKNNMSIWRECVRVRTKLDVRKPIKRKKKITRRDGTGFFVQCKYERLGDFVFPVAIVTHRKVVQKILRKRPIEATNEWGGWLRAPSRRQRDRAKVSG